MQVKLKKKCKKAKPETAASKDDGVVTLHKRRVRHTIDEPAAGRKPQSKRHDLAIEEAVKYYLRTHQEVLSRRKSMANYSDSSMAIQAVADLRELLRSHDKPEVTRRLDYSLRLVMRAIMKARARDALEAKKPSKKSIKAQKRHSARQRKQSMAGPQGQQSQQRIPVEGAEASARGGPDGTTWDRELGYRTTSRTTREHRRTSAGYDEFDDPFAKAGNERGVLHSYRPRSLAIHTARVGQMASREPLVVAGYAMLPDSAKLPAESELPLTSGRRHSTPSDGEMAQEGTTDEEQRAAEETTASEDAAKENEDGTEKTADEGDTENEGEDVPASQDGVEGDAGKEAEEQQAEEQQAEEQQAEAQQAEAQKAEAQEGPDDQVDRHEVHESTASVRGKRVRGIFHVRLRGKRSLVDNVELGVVRFVGWGEAGAGDFGDADVGVDAEPETGDQKKGDDPKPEPGMSGDAVQPADTERIDNQGGKTPPPTPIASRETPARDADRRRGERSRQSLNTDKGSRGKVPEGSERTPDGKGGRGKQGNGPTGQGKGSRNLRNEPGKDAAATKSATLKEEPGRHGDGSSRQASREVDDPAKDRRGLPSNGRGFDGRGGGPERGARAERDRDGTGGEYQGSRKDGRARDPTGRKERKGRVTYEDKRRDGRDGDPRDDAYRDGRKAGQRDGRGQRGVATSNGRAEPRGGRGGGNEDGRRDEQSDERRDRPMSADPGGRDQRSIKFPFPGSEYSLGSSREGRGHEAFPSDQEVPAEGHDDELERRSLVAFPDSDTANGAVTRKDYRAKEPFPYSSQRLSKQALQNLGQESLERIHSTSRHQMDPNASEEPDPNAQDPDAAENAGGSPAGVDGTQEPRDREDSRYRGDGGGSRYPEARSTRPAPSRDRGSHGSVKDNRRAPQCHRRCTAPCRGADADDARPANQSSSLREIKGYSKAAERARKESEFGLVGAETPSPSRDGRAGRPAKGASPGRTPGRPRATGFAVLAAGITDALGVGNSFEKMAVKRKGRGKGRDEEGWESPDSQAASGKPRNGSQRWDESGRDRSEDRTSSGRSGLEDWDTSDGRQSSEGEAPASGFDGFIADSTGEGLTEEELGPQATDNDVAGTTPDEVGAEPPTALVDSEGSAPTDQSADVPPGVEGGEAGEDGKEEKDAGTAEVVAETDKDGDKSGVGTENSAKKVVKAKGKGKKKKTKKGITFEDEVEAGKAEEEKSTEVKADPLEEENKDE